MIGRHGPSRIAARRPGLRHLARIAHLIENDVVAGLDREHRAVGKQWNAAGAAGRVIADDSAGAARRRGRRCS